jgi:hypothetical protein
MMTKTDGIIGVIRFSERVRKIPSKETFAIKAPIEIAVKINENRNTEQLDQKTILAIFKTGIILTNFDLLVKIVIMAAINPMIKANPVISVTIDFYLVMLFKLSLLTNGIC